MLFTVKRFEAKEGHTINPLMVKELFPFAIATIWETRIENMVDYGSCNLTFH